MALKRIPQYETRSEAQLREHYRIEKILADRLRHSSREERRRNELYLQVYDELFRKVPHHPQLTEKTNPEYRQREIARQERILEPYFNPQGAFLELGPGDCLLSLAVCPKMKKVFAVDVSREITRHSGTPDNFELIFSDGASVPVPAESVSLAYSNQLMEHCHPEDAQEQLKNLFASLAPGGRYLCVTPHRFSGPHDISRYFDDVATGFHLQEYTNRELNQLFREVGFDKIEALIGLKGIILRVPVWLVIAFEDMLAFLPMRWRRSISQHFPLRQILGIRLLATKKRSREFRFTRRTPKR